MRCAVLFSCLLMLALPSGRLAARTAPADTSALILDGIDISGNKVTRRAVILRELNMAPGDTVRAADLERLQEEARRRLLNLSLFTKVEVRFRVTGPQRTALDIAVQERWYLIPRPIFQLADRNFNVWWGEMNRDLRRVNAGLTLTDQNFRGNLETLAATVQAGYTQQLALAYTRPYIGRSRRHGFGAFAGVVQSGEIPYRTDSNKLRFARLPGTHIIRQWSGGVSWFYRPAYAVRHSLTLSLHDARISDTVRQLNRDYFDDGHERLAYAELHYRLDYNGVDNWNYPLRGVKWINEIIGRKGFAGMDYQAQWRTEIGIFRQFRHRWLGAAVLRGRLSFPDDVPYPFRSALGSRTEYIRGYEYYVVDGTHYGLLRLNLKRELLNTSFRLPFRYLPLLPLRIYPKVFADAGAVRNPYPGNSFLNDRLLCAAGVGVDIVSAYDFKLRLELAINQLGQYGLYLHLNSE